MAQRRLIPNRSITPSEVGACGALDEIDGGHVDEVRHGSPPLLVHKPANSGMPGRPWFMLGWVWLHLSALVQGGGSVVTECGRGGEARPEASMPVP